MVRYHRHAFAFETLVAFLARPSDAPEKFQFCPVCKCIPTAMIAETPHAVTMMADVEDRPWITGFRGLAD